MEVLRLLVKDFDGCFRFYSENLNLKVVWGKIGDVYASFEVNGKYEIGLFQSDLMAEFLENSDKFLPHDHREKIMITIYTDDVDEKYDELVSRGIEFIKPPTEVVGWGMKVAYLRDPENNLIEIYTPLQRGEDNEST
jgi:catechol 2,3-dioxygenase-like lactoylglutathione lyase family enzyme